MKIKQIIVISILVFVAANLIIPQFAQGERQCIQNQICVVPNDYLKYYASGFGSNATSSINFGDFIKAIQYLVSNGIITT